MGVEHPKVERLPLTATLRDGRSVTVREIRSDDKDELEAAFGRLSADSRYTRFFAPLRHLPKEMLDATIHPVPDRKFALVALSGVDAGQIIIGGSHYVLTAGGDNCEFAVTIADDWQGLGLARLLMETLIEIARARGVRRMEGHVLSVNTEMRGLAMRLGFADAPCPEDRTLRMVSLDLE